VQHAAYAVQCVLATTSNRNRVGCYSKSYTLAYTLCSRYDYNAQLTTYDVNSNELKAAKRRIYRQRQKTEEHRQILRYVLTVKY
jgi:chemotaxis methyl-accepting protein methylase